MQTYFNALTTHRSEHTILTLGLSKVVGQCYYQGLISLPFLLALIFSIAVQAAEPIPIVNPLYMDQRKAQMIAAPSGQDVAPPEIEVMQAMPKQASPPPSSEIEKNIAQERRLISLEEKIQRQTIQSELQQFGYELFSQVPSTYVPVTNIPVPSDYILGPGDTLIVQLFGKTNVEYQLVVTREGKILLPELGPFQVSGLTFLEVKEQLKSRFESQVFGTKAAVTIGNLRTINIMVVGDVVKPGSYTLAGLTRLMNALLNSGGVKRTGSLRNIQLKRNGRLISELDIYEVLLKGNTRSDVRLADGDVIFVPPIGPTVGIGGEVLRPAIYELKREKQLGQLLDLAGGLLPSAAIHLSHIDRVKNGQFHTLIDLPSSLTWAKQVAIKGGDLVRIFPVKKQIDDVVLLSGHILRPGGYQLQKRMKVSDLIGSPLNLRTNADTQFALLRRELKEQRKIAVHYLDLKQILQRPGSKADIFLKSRDEVVIFDLGKSRAKTLASLSQQMQTQSTAKYPKMIFRIDGHVRYEGLFPLAYGARFLDVLKIAGKTHSGVDGDYILLARKTYPKNQLEMFSLSLSQAQRHPRSEHNPIIHPEDHLFVFSQNSKRNKMIAAQIQQLKAQTAYGQEAPVVSISGSIKQAGEYPLEPGMRISRLLTGAGGLMEQSFGIQAQLTRYELIDGEYHIAEHKPVDLQAILAGHQSADLILHAHDHLIIHRKPQWQNKRYMVLEGEVKYPGSYAIEANETLCNVIQRAGGLTAHAYPFGAVFLRESVKQKQQKSLDRIHDNLDDLLVQLHLSPSARNNEKMPAGEQKHHIEKVIRKLKRTQATGRMVINLEQIQKCDEQADILLEDKDKLLIPRLAYEVSVMGEVYHPSTHSYDGSKGSFDYISLSGGPTLLAKNSHAYVVQANGEVLSTRDQGWFDPFKNIQVKPGATIYVPINVDRINHLETAQSWSEVIFHLALSAAGVGVLLGL